MAKRRTQTRAQVRQEIAETAQNGAEITDFSDGEADTIERINAALSDEGGEHAFGLRINEVFKTPEGAWKEGWVFNAEVGEMNTLRERIAQECGPGRYRVRVLRDGRPFKQYDLEIRMTMAQRRAAANPAAPAPAILPAPALAAAGGDLGGLMLQAINNQSRMLEAIGQRLMTPPAAPSFKEMLETMQLMAGMMPKAAEPPAPETGFKMFMQAFELSEKLHGERAGDGGTGSNMIDLVRDTLRELPNILRTVQQVQAPNGAPPQLTPPSGAPAQPVIIPAAPAATSPRPPASPQERVAQLKAYLLQEAAKGTDPAMCADHADELMPQELFEAIGAAPDPIGMLLQAWPDAAPYRAWFEKLIAEFFEAGDPAEAEPGQPHDLPMAANRAH